MTAFTFGEKTTRSVRVCLAVACTLLAATSDASAEPPFRADDGYEWVQTPVRVEVGPDGSSELVLAWRGPFEVETAAEERDRLLKVDEVPVFSRRADGVLVRGLVVTNLQLGARPTLSVSAPAYVLALPDNAFSLATREVQVEDTQGRLVPSALVIPVDGFESIPLASEPQDDARPRLLVEVDLGEDALARVWQGFVTRPAWVERGDDDSWRIVTAQMHPAADDREMARIRPAEMSFRRVPLLSRYPDGTLALGVVIRADQANGHVLYPALTWIEADGRLTLDLGGRATVTETVDPATPAEGPPFRTISRATSVAVYRRAVEGAGWRDRTKQRSGAEEARRGGATTFVIEVSGSPPAGITLEETFQAAHDAASVFSCLDSPAIIRVDLEWASLTGAEATTLMKTQNDFAIRQYQVTLPQLEIGASNDGETNEAVIYSDFPGGSLPVRATSGAAVTSVVELILESSLFQALSGVALPDAETQITINRNFDWDLDPSDGLGSSQFNFRTAFQHELFHALGFASETGSTMSPLRVTVLDCFRFGS